MKRIVSLVVVAVVLILAGCDDSSPQAVSPSATPSEVRSSPTPEDVVLDSRSRLLDVVVRPSAADFEVSAWWGCVVRRCQGRRAIATSSDGFATASYEKWTSREWLRLSPLPVEGHVPTFDGLAQETVLSMEDSAEGTQVVIAGGDGATLKPFQKVARSTDHGETWEAYDVAQIDGETASYYGAVGLAEGRLLVNLDHFSDDRRNAPGDRHHGLWISDGLDWTTYEPYRPTYTPALTPNPDGWSDIADVRVTDGVIALRTWDSKLYVSTDDAETFTEIAARSPTEASSRATPLQ